MKTKLAASLIFIALLFIYVFTSGSSYESTHETNILTSPPPAPGDDFLIGSLNTGAYSNYDYIADTLGYNLWHRYVGTDTTNGKVYPTGWTPSDSLFADNTSTYINDVKNILGTNIAHGMKTILQRPKIEYLCYGQRSDYQCESTHISSNYWFYSFNNHDVGTPYASDFPDNTYGGGAWVRKCVGNPSSPQAAAGFVVRRLMANSEQCRRNNGYDAYRGDSQSDWLIKPRIRIDSTVAHNQPNLPVCKIIVLSQTEDTLKICDIKARNFLDNDNNYNGRYLEQYRLFSGDSTLIVSGDWCGSDSVPQWSRGLCAEDEWRNHADIQVYWYGACDMYIDYVRVDNDIADELLNPKNPLYTSRQNWLQWEADIACNGNGSQAYQFYIELFEFNQVPCMTYVNRKLNEYQTCGRQFNVMADQLASYQSHMPWENRGEIVTPQKLKEMYFDSTGSSQVFIGDPYPLVAYAPQSCGWRNFCAQHSRIPTTLTTNSGNDILAVKVSPENYDAWLQMQLDTICTWYEGGTFNDTCRAINIYGDFQYLMKRGHGVSKLIDKPFIAMLQAHQWLSWGEVDREPSNEELNLMTNVAVSYGAKGIMYWGFDSFHRDDCEYSKGIMINGITPRYTNVYGQPKWEEFKKTVKRLKTWAPALMSFNNTDRQSYIYRLEYSSCLSNTYFSDIKTYPPDHELSSTPSSVADDVAHTYIQAAVFKKESEPKISYFMLTNRRCSPVTASHDGGKRDVKIKFDNNTDWGTWKIINLENDNVVTTFNRNASPYVDLGWFMPGEGRLYKLAPVLVIGGELLADEEIENESFTCEDIVYNNGHNITIGANTTIHFNDSSKIVMDSGSFSMGNAEVSGSQSITSDAVNGSSWRGYSFNNCEVRIYGATFGGLTNDTTYAINIVDCPVVDIRNSTFSTNASLKGGINAVYYSTSTIDNIYIGGNMFTSIGSTLPQLQVMSYAGITTPLIIENNTFNYGSTAILLSGVTGGAIKDNNITDYNIAINLLTSSVDVSENTIVSSMSNSFGIFGAGGSEIKMNNSGAQMLGGMNDISNTGNYANNMKIDNSYFLIDRGENIFNINETNAYHLSGFFNPFVSVTTDATENCFKFNSNPVDPPYHNVTWGDQGPPVSFTFTPYLTGCTPADCEAPIVLDLGDGIYDTICSNGIGSGGGESSSIKNYELGITNSNNNIRGGSLIPNPKQGNIPLPGGVSEGRGGLVILTPKQMYDSLSILMRHRNYTQAKTRCYDILNTYPDSLQSIYAISKLFLATIGSDTTTNTAQQLKTYYEGLILNHPNNIALVTRANYFIQKCKVRLRDYNSALTGFSQIINQNPYSYVALVARWDYMAASLLIQGSGGSESSIKNYELGITNNDQSEESDEFDKFDESGDDKSPYTKQQKQDIRKSIDLALETGGKNDERKMKILEESSSLGDVNALAELSQRKTIKEVAKSERPRNILEHVRIVAGDIRKVFGVNTSGKDGKSGKIPLVFRLSQNYPNPFNPVTKISYDLPRDSKVNIVIYDVLGREVKRLLNNEIKSAGSYIVDFNASNYASGVYFYRIEAEESNGNKFVDSKKMVLLK